jgi:transposase-like protein
MMRTVLMDSHKFSAQVERLEVVETGRRRRWSEDEKLKIVLESLQTPRAVSSTARRHPANALVGPLRRTNSVARAGATRHAAGRRGVHHGATEERSAHRRMASRDRKPDAGAEWAARQCLRASASCDREKVNEAVRDGIAPGPLRPAGTADQYGVPRATE